MQNRWSKNDAESFTESLKEVCSEEVARLIYASRLLGTESELVLHGGGNSSLKTQVTDIFGECRPALFVKASGHDMAQIAPQDFSALDLGALLRLRTLSHLSE